MLRDARQKQRRRRDLFQPGPKPPGMRPLSPCLVESTRSPFGSTTTLRKGAFWRFGQVRSVAPRWAEPILPSSPSSLSAHWPPRCRARLRDSGTGCGLALRPSPDAAEAPPHSQDAKDRHRGAGFRDGDNLARGKNLRSIRPGLKAGGIEELDQCQLVIG